MTAAFANFYPVDPGELDALVDLAREIWQEHYPAIISQHQIDYMLERFQSRNAITAQLEEGYRYFWIRAGGDNVGYFAVRGDDRGLFLSKFYIRAAHRGRGIGRQALDFVERLARNRGHARIHLTVNKRNPSAAVYERLGFRVTELVTTDIGGGFVMDDFMMEKALE